MMASLGPKTFAGRFMVRDFMVDPQRNAICGPAGDIHIEPKAMQVLTALIRRRDQVVTRTELIESIWQVEYGADESLTREISQLRKAFNDTRADPQFIETIPKRGYRFIAPVEAPDHDIRAEPAQGTGNIAARPGDEPPGRNGRRALVSIVGVIGVGAGAFILIDPGSREGAATDPPIRPAVVSPDREDAQTDLSIAVLPLVSVGDDSSDEYFADGLSEELMGVLGRIEGIRVAGRSGAFYFKERQLTPREIASALGARYILDGSVRRDGERLRVNVQLIDSHDGLHLWAESFDRPRTNIFEVQREISLQVARALKTEINPSPQLDAIQYDPEAHEYYLVGLSHYWRRELAEAIRLFRRAVEIDPDHALAQARLSTALLISAFQYETGQTSAYKDAKAAIEKALALAPDASEVVSSHALYLANIPLSGDDAISELKRAIELDPRNVEAWHWLGVFISDQSKYEEAERYYEAALAIDPFFLPSRLNLTTKLRMQKRWREADANSARIKDLYPEEPGPYVQDFTWARIRGQMDVAYDALSEWRLRKTPIYPFVQALHLADLGDVDGAVEMLGGIDVPELGEWGAASFKYLLTNRRRERLAFDERKYLETGLVLPREAAGDSALILGDNARALRYCLGPEAASDIDKLPTIEENNGVNVLCAAVALDRMERNEEAGRLYDALLSFLYQGTVQDFHWIRTLRAAVYANQGETNRAIEELRAAYDFGWRTLWNPYCYYYSCWRHRIDEENGFFEPIRSDPRFVGIISAIERDNAAALERIRAKWRDHQADANE